MPVVPALTTVISSGQIYYRITSPAFLSSNPDDNVKIVNGRGAVKSREGARYNYPGALTVYLTEDFDTCFAEKMFYFHRETVRVLDEATVVGSSVPVPPFVAKFILWEIEFSTNIDKIFDLILPNAVQTYNIIPSLVMNPARDYKHLKDKRAEVENQGYNGLRAPSSRSKTGGNIVALFDDQSGNIASLTPYEVEFRLIDLSSTQYVTPTVQRLDFDAGEIRMPAGYPFGGYTGFS